MSWGLKAVITIKRLFVIFFNSIIIFMFLNFFHPVKVYGDYIHEGMVSNHNFVVPHPKSISQKDFDIILDDKWAIVADLSSQEDYFTAQQLRKYLINSYNLALPLVSISNIYKDKNIILANPSRNKHAQFLCRNRGLLPDNLLGEEGYLLEVFSDETIVISSNYPHGIFYGLQTLMQLIHKKNGTLVVKAIKVKDWTENKIRGTHFCGADYKGKIYEQIDEMARLKFNFAIFEHLVNYNLKDPAIRTKIQDVFAYCRERYIEPVIDLGTPFQILIKDPHTAAGAWIQDERFRFINNVAEPVLPLDLHILNPGFEIDMDKNNIPDGWLLGPNWSWDNTISHSNNGHSVKVNVPSSEDNYSGLLSIEKEIEVTPDTWYGLRFFAKTMGVGGTYPPAMRVKELDEKGQPLSKGLLCVQRAFNLDVPSREWWQEDWRKGVLNFKTSPECKKIQIYASIYKGFGTAWFDDLKLVRINSALVNVLRTKATDIVITNVSKTKTYVEGIDYELKDGKMSFLGDDHCYYDIEHIPTKITRLTTGGIGENDQILVNYDSAIQVWTSSICGVRYCISEPRVHKGSNNGKWEGLYAAIDDVFTYLKPKYIFFSGASELKGINRDSRDLKRDLSNAELLAEDISNVVNYVRKKSPNTKVIMWDDMLNPWHNGGEEDYQIPYGGIAGKTAPAIDLISKDVMIVIWWYDPDDWLNKMRNSPIFFESKGFDYLAASWKDKRNIEDWTKGIKGKKGCQGIITTTWDGWENNIEGIKYTAEMAW